MRAKLNQRLVIALKPGEKVYEVNDIELRGFVLRVLPSGRKSYFCVYRKDFRRTRKIIAKAELMPFEEARLKARITLGQIAERKYPEPNGKKDNGITLGNLSNLVTKRPLLTPVYFKHFCPFSLNSPQLSEIKLIPQLSGITEK